MSHPQLVSEPLSSANTSDSEGDVCWVCLADGKVSTQMRQQHYNGAWTGMQGVVTHGARLLECRSAAGCSAREAMQMPQARSQGMSRQMAGAH